MDPEEKERMEKRDWLADKIQMLNTQMEGFEADLEKVVSSLLLVSLRLVPRCFFLEVHNCIRVYFYLAANMPTFSIVGLLYLHTSIYE